MLKYKIPQIVTLTQENPLTPDCYVDPLLYFYHRGRK